jgi:hypothetical protein
LRAPPTRRDTPSAKDVDTGRLMPARAPAARDWPRPRRSP